MEKRIIHVLLINNYLPELSNLTIPTIERYAEKICAKVNLITNRKYPDWPLLYEKIQIYEDGIDADWNILLDADILVHPETPDPFTPNEHFFIHPTFVAAKDSYNADRQLYMDDYFFRDGRNIGISTCAVASSRLCHDLWTPLEIPLDEAEKRVYKNRAILDEYCVSRNLARFGLKLYPILDPNKDYNKFNHLGAFGRSTDEMIEEARLWYRMHWK